MVTIENSNKEEKRVVAEMLVLISVTYITLKGSAKANDFF